MTSLVEATPHSASAFRIERDGDLGILWFDLPGEKINKFSSAVMTEFAGVVDELERDGGIKRIIVASGKPSIFIAGADVTEFSKATSAEQAREYTRFGQQTIHRFSKLSQVTVAAINGAALGGGCELALACDYRVMSDGPKAQIGLPETKLGIYPAWGGVTRLPRLIGLPAALDIILNGKTLDGKRAKKIGLVDEVVPASILLDIAHQFAAKPKRAGIERGLAREVDEVVPLIVGSTSSSTSGSTNGSTAGSDVAQNLIRLFFLMEDSKKERIAAASLEVRDGGVLGAGIMGGGIAQLIADKTDASVRMRDINWKAIAGGMKAAAKIWKKKVDRRRMTRVEMQRKLARITSTIDWSGFERCDLVIEAVVENVEIKRQVLHEFEAIAKPGAIFATNTSTIPITDIAAQAAKPENVAGMHFFNPVDRMPLVEVIRGAKTSEVAMATVANFARKLGKTVVYCNDGPGFVVNRILGPYMNEAGFLLEEGNTIESLDKAMVDFGMPMGPMALLDEVGIDVAAKVAKILSAAFGARMEPSHVVDALYTDGRYGKKNGKGLYLYEAGKRLGPDGSVYKLLGIRSTHPADAAAVVERMIFAMVNEAAMILYEKIVASPAELDLAMIMGTGFPPFRGGLLRYADKLGLPYILARLDDLAQKHGKRFLATAALRKLAERDGKFYR